MQHILLSLVTCHRLFCSLSCMQEVKRFQLSEGTCFTWSGQSKSQEFNLTIINPSTIPLYNVTYLKMRTVVHINGVKHLLKRERFGFKTAVCKMMHPTMHFRTYISKQLISVLFEMWYGSSQINGNQLCSSNDGEILRTCHSCKSRWLSSIKAHNVVEEALHIYIYIYYIYIIYIKKYQMTGSSPTRSVPFPQEQLFTVENSCCYPRIGGISCVNLYKIIYAYGKESTNVPMHHCYNTIDNLCMHRTYSTYSH